MIRLAIATAVAALFAYPAIEYAAKVLGDVSAVLASLPGAAG